MAPMKSSNPIRLQVHLDPLTGMSCPAERLVESIIQSTLTPIILFNTLPRNTQIQLHLQVLCQDGFVLFLFVNLDNEDLLTVI